MSALSIRKLPPAVEKALLRESKRAGKTKTQVVIEALRERFSLGHEAAKKRRIRDFFGKMNPSEYESFKEVTRDFSKIDENLWC